MIAVAAWVPTTRRQLEDAEALSASLNEMWRRLELANRGFLGLVRCSRCRRPVRCVYAASGTVFGIPTYPEHRLLLGRSCHAKVTS